MEVVTYGEYELSPIFYVCCIFFLILFGVYGFILMPIAYFLFKMAVHRCSRCLAHLGTNQYGMPDFSQEVSTKTFLIRLDIKIPPWKWHSGDFEEMGPPHIYYLLYGLLIYSLEPNKSRRRGEKAK